MADIQLQEIKDRLDVVEVLSGYIKVVKAGRNFKALCPFHNEKSPSFVISPDRQIWHCFGCGEGGDIFTFVMKIEGMEFPEALNMLAERAGVELKKTGGYFQKQENQTYSAKKTNVFAICQTAKNFYKEQLARTSQGQEAKKYLLGRGLTENSINVFEIGYALDDWHALGNFLLGRKFSQADIFAAGFSVKNETNGTYHDRFRGRVMFPILDISGRTVGFGGRTFAHKDSDEAKYINTPESPVYSKSKILYGLNFAREDIRKKNACILVEGYMDVIGSHQMGAKNAVSSSGTALTQDQIKIIKRYSENLILAFDGDLAGQEATSRSIDLATEAGMNIRIITLPDDKDPSDFVDDPEKWKNYIKSAKRIMDFFFENSFKKSNASSVEGKKAIAEDLLPAIKKFPSKIEQSHWIKILAEKIGVDEKTLFEELKNAKIEKNSLRQTVREMPKKQFSQMTKEEKWELQILALLDALNDFPGNMEHIKKSGLVFSGNMPVKIFEIFNKFLEQEIESGKERKKISAADAGKMLSEDLRQIISQTIIEMEYQKSGGEENIAGDEDGSAAEGDEWKAELFSSLLERLVILQYERRKRALVADIRLAEKNKDHATRNFLANEFAKIAQKTEEFKKAKL